MQSFVTYLLVHSSGGWRDGVRGVLRLPVRRKGPWRSPPSDAASQGRRSAEADGPGQSPRLLARGKSRALRLSSLMTKSSLSASSLEVGLVRSKGCCLELACYLSIFLGRLPTGRIARGGTTQPLVTSLT